MIEYLSIKGLLSFRIIDDVFGLKIIFLKPKEASLHYAVYAIFQEDYGKCFYFTVERNDAENLFFIGWRTNS